ncbi:MAG TPA: hypothetical protein PLJ17_10435 [Syntrophorhabdaceae bacterium]|nr:hypothetical protein [Syntrophorhabdaceae bacterium]HQH44179.1 hypothetical protein [Syntrophorhabdaceae bacterium]
MLPNSIEELDAIRKECRHMATKRAVMSSCASLVPVPLADVTTDIALLMKVIPAISEKFGLSKDQIDEYKPNVSIAIYELIKKWGADMVGKYITKEIIIQLLKKMGIRITAKQAAKYVPILGQAISVTISFTAMKLIIDKHINDCYKIVRELIESRGI